MNQGLISLQIGDVLVQRWFMLPLIWFDLIWFDLPRCHSARESWSILAWIPKKPSIHFIKIDGWHLTDNGLWWKLANAMLTSIFYCKHNEICCLTRQEFKTRKICMWFQMIYFTIYIWKINTPWKYMKVKS